MLTAALEAVPQQYTKNSLCSICFGLKRHFMASMNIDIIKSKEFDEANRVYQAQCIRVYQASVVSPSPLLDVTGTSQLRPIGAPPLNRAFVVVPGFHPVPYKTVVAIS